MGHREPAARVEGPASGGLIDQVWDTHKARSAKVLFALNEYSDHKPVVARYHLGAASY